jgi:O-antigen/teichoic acid export membrane protein
MVVGLVRAPLFANAGYLLTSDVVSALFGFLFWAIAARLYQPAEIGSATAALSAIALASGIASLGIGNGFIRFLPKAQAGDLLINSAFTFILMAGLVVGGLFVVGLPLCSPSLSMLGRSAAAQVGFVLFSTAMTLNAAVRSIFLAHRKARYALFHASVVNLVRISLLAVLAGLGTAGLLLSVGLGFCLALALSLTVLLPRLRPDYRFRPRLDLSVLAYILPFSMGNHVAGLLAQSSRMLLPLAILEMLGPESNGHAYIAWMLGGFLTAPGLALATSAFAEGANAPHDSERIVATAAVAGLLLTCGAALFLAILAPWLLVLFGHTYLQESASLLRWLAAAGPLAVVAQLYFTHLRIHRRMRSLILGNGVIAGLTLGLSLWLMPKLGIVASGMGWTAANGLVAVWGLVAVYRTGMHHQLAARLSAGLHRKVAWRQ